jgi:hypothetical protein
LAQEDDAIAQESRVNVKSAFAATGLFYNCWDH